MKISIDKQKEFIKEFESKRQDFIDFAELLDKVLKKMISELGILAIVQKRAKEVDSFSTKIIDKDKYLDPLTEMTDLAGARIIVQFQSQVVKVCDVIKGIFDIDTANSLDHKSRLKVNEFGYRSVHYIVTPKENVIFQKYLIEVDEKFTKMKAEIQVRTLAEHIWADISHDRIYKTRLTIPEEWRREAARLSAILENTDNIFTEMSNAIDSVGNVYELQYKTEEAKREMEKLETLITIQEKKPTEGIKKVMELISVYNALNLREKARRLILVWKDIMVYDLNWQARLEFEENMLDLTQCFGNIDTVLYLEKVAEAKKNLEILHDSYIKGGIPSARELSFLYYRYSCILQNDHRKPNETLANITIARELMPDNPLYLTIFTECLILLNLELASRTITQVRNSLEKDISVLNELINLGIEAIPAWFAIGRSHFFLGNEKECISAYANAVSIIMDRNLTSNCYIIDSEIARVNRLSPFYEKKNSRLADMISIYLNIALAVSETSFNKDYYYEKLKKWSLLRRSLQMPVIIVAGGASLLEDGKAETFRDYIKELIYGFEGTIISGGTQAGIPGLVGRIREELEENGSAHFNLLAYLPRRLPKDAVKSKAYYHLETDSDQFSAFDILSSWVDIILSGIKPSEVIIIGIEGGELAQMEYLIALSLGAKVCLVANSGRAATDFIQEKELKNAPNLIELPMDPFTLWAIASQNKNTLLTESEIEILAPLVHEHYRTRRKQKFTTAEDDINKYKEVIEWEYLDNNIRNSNKVQVAFYEHILKRVGLGIRKSNNPVLFNIKEKLNPDDYMKLAKLEHARWNAERLLNGWKYGPQKDLTKKINPYLVSWDKLDDSIKPYDFEPVDNIPLMLKMIGYEVFQPE